jgi:hypothetical protein
MKRFQAVDEKAPRVADTQRYIGSPDNNSNWCYIVARCDNIEEARLIAKLLNQENDLKEIVLDSEDKLIKENPVVLNGGLRL